MTLGLTLGSEECEPLLPDPLLDQPLLEGSTLHTDGQLDEPEGQLLDQSLEDDPDGQLLDPQLLEGSTLLNQLLDQDEDQ